MSPVLRDPARLFSIPAAVLEHLPDGSFLLKSGHALSDYPRSLGMHLDHWAVEAPDRWFILERNSTGDWSAITYAETRARVRRVATSLLRRGLSLQHPLMILSDNAVEHALLMLAAMYVGIPSVSVSSAYSLMSSDFGKLRQIVGVVDPGLIYACSGPQYAPALRAIEGLHCADVVIGDQFSEVEVAEESGAVDAAANRVGPETVAKLLFTSGSTDTPKGVINTHRMLVSNQQARAQHWPFLNHTPPVLLDWLPWSHTFGGNHNFNLVLRFGGTLYIDGGRPTPALFKTTIQNLKEVAPTVYFNVPRGYDMLVGALKRDALLRERFFSRLQVLFYAAAALPQYLWDALIDLSVQTLGEQVSLVSAWGATETAPTVADCHFQASRAGVIGVPIPGSEIKLIKNGMKLEARARGPNITPGYHKRPDLTAAQFDADGFYMTGDAVRFVDLDRPEQGLLFDGRVAEDFKLDSGTWVNVGMLRVKAIAALAPIAQDIVLTGHNRPWIGFLIFPNINACRELCGEGRTDTPIQELFTSPILRSYITSRLAKLQAEGGGSSTYATAALLLDEIPSIDAGEITDKGYINQRAVLTRRCDLVERLYDLGGTDIIHLD